MAIYLFLAAPYVIAFVLLAFLPGWRSLLLFTVAALLLSRWQFNETYENGDGPGLLLALPMILCAALGFFAGFLARAIVLASQRFGWHLTGRATVTLPMVLVGVAAGMIALERLNDARRAARLAPPSPECVETTHAARLGDVVLDVPIAPVIHVGSGVGYDPNYSFEINEHARQFCDLSKSSQIVLTHLTFDLSWYGNRYDAKRFAFCARRRAFAWWSAACERKEEALAAYPEMVTVYAIAEYESARIQVLSAQSSIQYRSAMLGLPIRAVGDGSAVEHIGKHQSYYTRSGADDYIAECRAASGATDGEDLYCQTGFALPSGLGLIYRFRAKRREFALQSEQIDKAARAILESLVRR
jgi:hypothetical protein